MLIDHFDRAAPTDIDADLCIVGAGPAGIAMARAFIGTRVRICLIESGGLTSEPSNQELYEGSSIGLLGLDPGLSRLRAFGGSCNLWGGGCIPLSDSDFGPRDWVPHSGWPLSYAELQPYYARAQSFCRIGPYDFSEGTFLTPPSRPPVRFDDNKLVNQIFIRSPILFGAAYRSELERAQNVTVLLHANLLDFTVTPSGSSVCQARISSLDGRRGVIRARHYVLACGGIENARLLLLSDSVVPTGLGNDHDLVGRFFMDHPAGEIGKLFTANPDGITRPYLRAAGKVPAPAFPEIGLSINARRTHRLLNGRVHPIAVEGPVPKGIRALRELRLARSQRGRDESSLLEERLCAALRHDGPTGSSDAAVPAGMGRLALRLGLGVGDIAKAYVRKLGDRPAVKSDHVKLVGYFEQAPNPDSRVMLGTDRDALGQRKICVDWQLTELDRHTYRRAAALFGAEFARVCGGTVELEPWLDQDDSAIPQVHGTAHHLGTTRMSEDPRHGVVDRHCRVHGLDNLHVVGSSVFPTGGWAFPTFTIVALSLRLAERLQIKLTARSSSHEPPVSVSSAA